MPQCIIEYSKEVEKQIDIQEVVSAVYKGSMNSEMFESNTVKIRAYGCEYHQTGTEKSDFIHVQVKIFSGRTLDLKQKISAAMLEALKTLKVSGVTLSVEIVDTDKESGALIKI